MEGAPLRNIDVYYAPHLSGLQLYTEVAGDEQAVASPLPSLDTAHAPARNVPRSVPFRVLCMATQGRMAQRR